MPRGRKAGKPVAEIKLEQAFFRYLTAFYRDNRGTIRKSYRVLTREFLDWNDREKRPGAFLRPPQFEALEIYVFLKEYVGNQPVHRIFNDWYHRTGRFADRPALGLTAEEEAQTLLFTVEQAIEKAAYEKLYAAMKAAADINTEGMGPGFPNPPPNYIFALTMGTGKTLLMATCLLYEFLLAHKFPKDDKYAHNALVFAPDTTVRESLREIETFDHSLLLPPEHARVLLPLLRFQVLGDGETNLALLDGSDFNVVISNAQKIILRRQHQAPTAGQQLFRPEELSGGHARAHALLASGAPQSDAELTVNQRFQKLCRLKHLAVYIDEAHHAFGKALAKDLGQAGERAEDKSSFRLTVETLIRELDARGSRVIGTFCYTGTPYADGQLFPEVVYAYGLNEAIKTRLLKKLDVVAWKNMEPTSQEFVDLVIDDFLGKTDQMRPEGMQPKLAIFARTVIELINELKPAVEAALARHGLPATRVLVNVDDDAHTSHADVVEFRRLDTVTSEKQVILLIGRGREGWNCRSLFGVALYRKPKSRVFVLQATLRCLREIGRPTQHTGLVYVSEENRDILDAELQHNFKVSLAEVRGAGSPRETVVVRPVPPPVKLTIRRLRHRWRTVEKQPQPGVELGVTDATGLKDEDVDAYRLIRQEWQDVLGGQQRHGHAEEAEVERAQRHYSALTLTAECARYLHVSPLVIQEMLRASAEGMDATLTAVNRYNQLVHAKVVPALFRALCSIEPDTTPQEPEEIVLVRDPGDGGYKVSADPDKIVDRTHPGVQPHAAKSFHLSHYCFDSTPEKQFFFDLIREGAVGKIYFTGMLTHGQTDFCIDYVDPHLHTVRTYYPDFLIRTTDDEWLVVEVKGDNELDDKVVAAKMAAAITMTSENAMRYRMIASTHVMAGLSAGVLSGDAVVLRATPAEPALF